MEKAQPTARPTSGPRTTFCGRSPIAPANAPTSTPTTTGPAPVSLPSAQPSGAISATLITMRDHSAGIWPGRCRARATASETASVSPPSTAPATMTDAPQPAVIDTPATAPMTLASPIDIGVALRADSSEATPTTYRWCQQRGR